MSNELHCIALDFAVRTAVQQVFEKLEGNLHQLNYDFMAATQIDGMLSTMWFIHAQLTQHNLE